MEDMAPILRAALKAAPREESFGPWRLTIRAALGGGVAAGFDREEELLLVASASGQGLYDCRTGERLHRDRDEDAYDPARLEARRLDRPAAAPIPMAGLDGGGLRRATADGWTAEILTLDWPTTCAVVQPPGASIYFLNPGWRGLGKDARFHLAVEAWGEPRAFGFSWSGESLLWLDSSDLFVWSRFQS